MSERLSTAGMSLNYAVETKAGTRPTTGYKEIPEIKTMPSFNPAPNTIQSTTLMDPEYHTYEQGLKDLGGALEYGANLTNDIIDFCESLVDEYKDAAAEGKAMWFVIVHPKLNKSLFFKGEPAMISINEVAVDSMLETTLYITPNSAPEWGTKPTMDTSTVSAQSGTVSTTKKGSQEVSV